MTFTFDSSLADNTSLVRFHIGDTNDDGYYLEDETIDYWVTETGSVADAVIVCIQFIISQLSSPNFRLDWMRIDNDAAAEGYRELLAIKRQELGVASSAYGMMDVAYPYRADSDQDEDEEYDGS